MTPERDERNNDVARRRMQRRRQQVRQRRQASLRVALMMAVLLMAVALIIWVSIKSPAAPQTQPTDAVATQPAQMQPTEDVDETKPTEPTTVIHIAAAGDLNVTDGVIANAATFSGYDFTGAFLDVAPVLAAADLSMVNFEGTLSGAPFGQETGSAPAALAECLANMGVDAVQTANSAAIRSGVLGLQSTLSGLRSAGLIPVGTFADRQEFRRSGGYTVVEVEGIRIALVAFTKGMDNLGLPEGSEDCVNLLYEDYTTDYKNIDTDGITDVLRKVASEQAALTVALLHWGSEYNENISKSQEKIRDLMLSNGVDAIIGSHSHLLQAIEFDETEGTLVAWSLGDFYGDATQAGSNYSVILDLEVTMDNLTGQTAITGYSTTPIYTLRPEQSISGGLRVVQVDKAMARFESGYVHRMTQEAYDSLSGALGRIEKRLSGE